MSLVKILGSKFIGHYYAGTLASSLIVMLRWLYSTWFQTPCTIQRALLKPRNKEGRKPRLTTENTDYQLGWAALAKCRQLNFLFNALKFLATSTDVNKLFVSKSLLSIPSNVLPFHLKETVLPIIWIWTEGEFDGTESRLPFKIFSTLLLDIN